MRLAEAFVGAGSPRAVELDALLHQLLATAERAWPGVSASPEAFAKALARSVAGASDPVVALANVHASELYLTTACAAGNPAAMAAFERSFVARLPRLLAGNPSLAPFLDELAQALRVELLAAEGDRAPRIGRYDGRGSLEGWVRVVATRMGVRLRRAARRDHDFTMELGPPSSHADPELRLVKEQFRAEFTRALTKVLQALPRAERNAVRLHVVHGLSAAEIARSQGASPRTVQRGLAATRQAILDGVAAELTRRLDASQVDLGAILALVESQLHVTLSALGPRRRGNDPSQRS